jgi:hypothetical protein
MNKNPRESPGLLRPMAYTLEWLRHFIGYYGVTGNAFKPYLSDDLYDFSSF